MQIEPLAGREAGAWDDFIASHTGASQCFKSAWRSVIATAFGHECPYLLAREGGRVIGVLPLVRVRSRLFGDYMVSMPYLNYGGALAESTATVDELMRAACERAREAGCSHVEFRDTAPRKGWPARTDKVVMELDLPPSHDALMKSIGAKVRSQVKRPLREGASAVVGGIDLLDDFYAVFARNMRDLGTPVYAKRFFATVLQTFPDDARLHVVRLGGSPVAAGLVLGFGDRLEIPWASSLREHNRIGVNMMLYGEVLRHAIEDGYRLFDFGRSSLDSGTFRFKAQWGAKPRQLHWHYWLREGEALPGLTPGNPKYRFAIALWQRMPVALANLIGPHVVRGLP